MDTQARMDRARTLLRAKRFDEALAEYEWLWTNIPAEAPSFGAVRVSFMAMYIRQLCEIHDSAKLRFRQLRDEAAAAADSADVGSDVRHEWMVLNEIIGEEDASLRWLERVDLSNLSGHRLNRVLELLGPKLIARGRWRQFGLLHQDPVTRLGQHHEVMRAGVASGSQLPEPLRTTAATALRKHWNHQAQVLYRSLLAADRDEEANAVFHEAIRLQDSPDLRWLLKQAAAARR